MSNQFQEVLKLARARKVLRARDVASLGIPRRVLSELTEAGRLTRTGWGMYTLKSAKPSEHRSFVEASTRVPNGVICLLSALRFHDLTSQNPWEVWMAIGQEGRKPKVDNPPLRVVRFSGKMQSEGIEKHRLEGVEVQIYSVPKTIIDCFRFRNKIGVDIAIEALREAWNRRWVTADELWHYATLGRVTRVIRPYIESLIA